MKITRCICPMMVLATVMVSRAFAADTFTVDRAHSEVAFAVTHLMISDVKGGFRDFTGEVVWDEADTAKCAITGTIKAASLDTENAKRDEHLRGPDFLDTAKFPDISFRTQKIEKRGEQWVGVGSLTLKGVTKTVEVPFTITPRIKDPWGQTRIALKGNLTIPRKDYGITWNQALDGGGVVVGEEVKMTLAAEAILKAP